MAIINTFFYSVRQGIKNIFRNKMFSIASVATMAACIFMFGLFSMIIDNLDSMVKKAEEGVAVTVFFDTGITTEELQALANDINDREEVSKLVYVSAEEAWESFQTVYFEGQEELAEGFADDNPLANSANFEIYLKDVAYQDQLVEYLGTLDGIRSIKESEAVANTLADFNRLLSYVSFGIIFILLAVAVFLISNTITVGINVRKEEIGIMKLIGATDFLVRLPFVVEGMVIGLVGALIPIGLLYVMYNRIVAYIAAKFNFIGSMVTFLPAKDIFSNLVPIALALGVGIGFVGSMFTIRKHLQV